MAIEITHFYLDICLRLDFDHICPIKQLICKILNTEVGNLAIFMNLNRKGIFKAIKIHFLLAFIIFIWQLCFAIMRYLCGHVIREVPKFSNLQILTSKSFHFQFLEYFYRIALQMNDFHTFKNKIIL